MPKPSNWGSNDREQSKPSWLTPAQARNAVRTKAGWEIPLWGGFKSLSGGNTGSNVVPMELIVAMPIDATSNSDYTTRTTDITGGTTSRTSGVELSDAPYFTSPLTGDGPTSGGLFGSGLSALSVIAATTTPQFIPLYAQSANSSRLAGYGGFSFSGPFNDSGTTAGFTGWSLLPGSTLSSNLGLTTFNYYQPRGFSGFAGITQGVAALKIVSGVSGTYNTTMYVNDGSLTGSVRFSVRIF